MSLFKKSLFLFNVHYMHKHAILRQLFLKQVTFHIICTLNFRHKTDTIFLFTTHATWTPKFLKMPIYVN
jgi:hypothetical protein